MKAHRHTIETFVEVFVVDAKLREINMPLRFMDQNQQRTRR